MRRGILVLLPLLAGCVALTAEGARVRVYQAPLDAPAAARAMPPGCALVSTLKPRAMTEVEIEGQKDPFRDQRNEAGAAGANAILVLSKQTVSRRNLDCPSASRITDCPPSSGAWYSVVVEQYACSADAIRALDHRSPKSTLR